MKKWFEVTVVGFKTVVIEAENEDEAQQDCLDWCEPISENLETEKCILLDEDTMSVVKEAADEVIPD